METAVKEKSQAQELLKIVKVGVARIHDSAEWKAWLDASAKFWKYSFHNQMLIRWQQPESTRVAGYRTWRQFGRQVKKGERGIKILVPYFVKVPVKDGVQEKLVPVVRGFGVASVFDISQTEGEDLPEIYHPLQGSSVPGILEALTKYASAEGYKVRIGKTSAPDIYGYVNDRKEIVLKEGESLDQQTSTLAHEISHALLNHLGSFDSASAKELEAETAAWIVCRNLGLETDAASFGYMASWTNEENRDAKLERGASRACEVAEKILAHLVFAHPAAA